MAWKKCIFKYIFRGKKVLAMSGFLVNYTHYWGCTFKGLFAKFELDKKKTHISKNREGVRTKGPLSAKNAVSKKMLKNDFCLFKWLASQNFYQTN